MLTTFRTRPAAGRCETAAVYGPSLASRPIVAAARGRTAFSGRLAGGRDNELIHRFLLRLHVLLVAICCSLPADWRRLAWRV